jgi:hypothetical protein
LNLADATLEHLFEQTGTDPETYMRLFEILEDFDITITGVDGLEVPILDATIADLQAHRAYSRQRRLFPPGALN